MRTFGLVLLLSGAALAQYNDGVSVSVSRTVTLAADEAAFTVLASTGLDGTAEQVLQVLQTAGLQNLSISGTGLGQTYSYPEASGVLTLYQISFTVPAANLKDAAKKLEVLRITPPELLKSLQYTASVNASAAAIESGRQSILPKLLAEARQKAQFLADSAGVKLGGVKGVNENSYGVYALVGNWINSSTVMTTGYSSSNSGGIQFTYYAAVTFNVAQ